MAKKHAPKQKTQKAQVKDRGRVLPPVERASMELASVVAASVQLKDMFFDEFHARRTPQAFSDPSTAQVQSGPENIEVARSPEGRDFNIRITFVLRVVDADAPDFTDPGLDVRCRAVLLYSVPSLEGITDDHLFAFAQTSGVFSVWPYWREFVQSATYRLSVPQILLPTYRI